MIVVGCKVYLVNAIDLVGGIVREIEELSPPDYGLAFVEWLTPHRTPSWELFQDLRVAREDGA